MYIRYVTISFRIKPQWRTIIINNCVRRVGTRVAFWKRSVIAERRRVTKKPLPTLDADIGKIFIWQGKTIIVLYWWYSLFFRSGSNTAGRNPRFEGCAFFFLFYSETGFGARNTKYEHLRPEWEIQQLFWNNIINYNDVKTTRRRVDGDDEKSNGYRPRVFNRTEPNPPASIRMIIYRIIIIGTNILYYTLHHYCVAWLLLYYTNDIVRCRRLHTAAALARLVDVRTDA